MTPTERLARDVQDIRDRRARLEAKLGDRRDKTRLLVVLSAAAGAEKHLPCSLPKLLAQTRAAGRSVDLLIGCNDGFEAERTFAELAAACALRRTTLHCTKAEPNVPARVLDATGNPRFLESAEADEDRCFVVLQRSDPAKVGAGKIRMLGDLYGWIEDSILAGWVPPALLLACDAESEFDRSDSASSLGHGDPALAILLARFDADPGLDLVGTRNRFTAFEEDTHGVRRPRLDVPLPAVQEFLNFVHTRASGFAWLPGGGTLGRTTAMTAMLGAIAAHYPSARIEDAMSSVLAGPAGFRIALEAKVASLNRCAPRSDPRTARAQMDRWISGNKDLARKYGGRVLAPIAQPSVILVFLTALWLVLCDVLHDRANRGRLRIASDGARVLFALLCYGPVAHRLPEDHSDDPEFPAGW